MVWVTATATEWITIAAPIADVFAAILDVASLSSAIPGCEKVEPAGDRTFRLVLRERRALGWVHRPDYTVRYTDNGVDQIAFEPVGGNFESRGRWYLTETSSGLVRVSHSVTGMLEAGLPRFLKRPATLFANKDLRSAVRAQLRALRVGLEVAGQLRPAGAY